jgi:hypothetical protein
MSMTHGQTFYNWPMRFAAGVEVIVAEKGEPCEVAGNGDQALAKWG